MFRNISKPKPPKPHDRTVEALIWVLKNHFSYLVSLAQSSHQAD